MLRILIAISALLTALLTNVSMVLADEPDVEAAIAWLDSLNQPPVVYTWQLDKTVPRPVNATAEERFNGIVALDLGGTYIVDEDLKHLVGMPKLQRLAHPHLSRFGRSCPIARSSHQPRQRRCEVRPQAAVLPSLGHR